MEKFKYSKDNPTYEPEIDHEQTKRTVEACRKTIERINNGEDVDIADNFNMVGAMLLTGYSIDEIRIKLMNAYTDENLKAQLVKATEAPTLSERLIYPGGYDQFVKDVHDKIYGDMDLFEEE